jgi:hypothetical protein
LSVALSRNAASSSMLSESKSIFAMQASRFLVATGKVRGPQGRRRSYPPRTSNTRANHNRAPIAATNGRGTRIKGMGMPEQQDNAAQEREEIAARVASFKATQEKFEREREEYFVTTLENARHSFGRPSFWS